MFTTFSGIVVYDDMTVLSDEQRVLFIMGLLTAVYGVKRISVIHQTSS